MNKSILSVLLIIFVAMACQKESSLDTGTTPTDQAAEPLQKLVQVYGEDSSIYTFFYDAAKRLTGINITDVYSGVEVATDYVIDRDASGRIIKTTATGYQSPEPDVTRYVYLSNGNLGARVNKYTFEDVLYTDSSVLVYNNQGVLTGENHYLSSSSGLASILYYKLAYVSDAQGNITQMRDSSFDVINNGFEWNTTITFTYDAKINPLKFAKNDIYAIGLPALGVAYIPSINMVAKNNLIKEDFAYSTSADDFSYNYFDYQYNDRSKPVSCKVDDTFSGIEWAIRYYY